MDNLASDLSALKLEETATARFRSYRDELVRQLGRGPLDSTTIQRIGRENFGAQWGGVGRQGRRMRPGRYYIDNTAWSARSPGVHWMAVAMSASGTPHIYDSYARPGARMLWKTARVNRWGSGAILNSDMTDAEQRGTTAICGHLSLAWLMTARDLGIQAAMTV